MINLKTLTLQLIDGEPNGIKICRLTGSTLVTVVIPRDLLAQGKSATESCFLSGFRNYSTFLRAYKQHYKELPKHSGRLKNSKN